MTTKIKGALGAVAVISVSVSLVFAFTGPSSGPLAPGNQSAGSLINQMAGVGFDAENDSLEILRERLDAIEGKVDAIPATTCAFEAVGVTDCNGWICGTNASQGALVSSKICKMKGYDWATDSLYDYAGGSAGTGYYWDGSSWVYTSNIAYKITSVHCCKQ